MITGNLSAGKKFTLEEEKRRNEENALAGEYY